MCAYSAPIRADMALKLFAPAFMPLSSIALSAPDMEKRASGCWLAILSMRSGRELHRQWSPRDSFEGRDSLDATNPNVDLSAIDRCLLGRIRNTPVCFS